MIGGVVSTTVTTVEHDAELPTGSVTVMASTLVPRGRTPLNETSPPPVGPAGSEFVCTGVPFKLHTTVSGAPGGPETMTVTVVAVPHSLVLFAAQIIAGGSLVGGGRAISCPRISPPGLSG